MITERNTKGDTYLKDNQGPASDKGRYKNLKKRIFTKINFLIFLILILLITLGFSFYLYKKEKEKVDNPALIASEESKKVKEKIGRLILLTEEEEPTIATIINIDTLKSENSEFYKYAQNGDKLILYSQRAMIYRPSDDILINVAPVIKQPEEGTADETESEGSSNSSDNNEGVSTTVQ